MIPLGYHGKKGRAGVLKNETPANLAVTIFLKCLPSPKEKDYGAATCPSTFGKAAQVFTNVGQLPPVWPVRTVGYISDE